MALISRSDLIYEKSYSWTAIAGDDPRVTGKPDSTRFNRNEGYEVLYLINKLAEEWKFKQKASAEKLERMIRNGLPSNVILQQDVSNWISTNWDSYK